jgi:hypothetical protein
LNLIAGTKGGQDDWIGRYVNAGDSLLYRTIGRRTGTAATATVKAYRQDIAGAADEIASFTMSATTGVWEMTAEYWLTATDTVNYLITFTDPDGTVSRSTGTLTGYALSDADVTYLFRATVTPGDTGDAFTTDVYEIEGTRGGGIY